MILNIKILDQYLSDIYHILQNKIAYINFEPRIVSLSNYNIFTLVIN